VAQTYLCVFVKILFVFLADRTNGRAIAALFRLSVCDVMYCG